MSSERATWSVYGPIKTGVFTLLLLVGGFGGWSVMTTLSGAVVASGQIEVDRNRQAIQHPDGGVVAELLVDEGDRVDASEVLVRLDPVALETELAVVRAQLAEVQACRARFEAERDDEDAITFPEELLEYGRESAKVADLLRGQENLFAARVDMLSREDEQLGGGSRR